jgi:hypothetical protein
MSATFPPTTTVFFCFLATLSAAACGGDSSADLYALQDCYDQALQDQQACSDDCTDDQQDCNDRCGTDQDCIHACGDDAQDCIDGCSEQSSADQGWCQSLYG